MALRLGVSRGPVREAFRGLEEVGLVRFEKNRGVFVREIDLAQADQNYVVRGALEALAARILAEKIRMTKSASCARSSSAWRRPSPGTQRRNMPR